jgi:hypothetical protein
MAGMTSFLQKKLLDHFLSIASYTAPAAVYVSLHTAAPGEAGSHATEIGASGYARQSILAKMSATDATTGISTSTATLTFGPAGADWGTINYLGLEDASTTGNMCMWGAPTTAKTVPNGESFQLIAGQLSIQFD